MYQRDFDKQDFIRLMQEVRNINNLELRYVQAFREDHILMPDDLETILITLDTTFQKYSKSLLKRMELPNS